MARTAKNNFDLFSRFLAGDFLNHPILQAISGYFGKDGFIIVVHLLHALRSQYCLKRSRLLIENIVSEASVEESVVNSVIDRLIDYEFFDEEMAAVGKLTSADIQRTWFSIVLRKAPTTEYADLLIEATVAEPKRSKKKPAATYTSTDDSCQRKQDMKEIMYQMLDDTEWQSQIEQQNNLDKGACRDWIEEFYSYCLSSERNHCYSREMRRHFANWLPIRLRNKQNATPKQSEYQSQSDEEDEMTKWLKKVEAASKAEWEERVVQYPDLFPEEYTRITGKQPQVTLNR